MNKPKIVMGFIYDEEKGYLTLEEYNKQIRVDAIEEFKQALHTQFEQNKALAKRCSRGDRVEELALTNIDLEEVDNIAEQLKEQK